MKEIFRRDKVILYLIVFGMCLFAVIDIYEDLAANEDFFVVLAEALTFGFVIFGIVVLLNKNFLLKTQIKDVSSELLTSHAEARKWQEQHQTLSKGLGEAIDTQFVKWNLSSSEKEIALFLLKGLSFKEIAEIRGTNEKTVRQQSLKIYEKSGLTGRSELSAFFLEDILSPIENSESLVVAEK